MLKNREVILFKIETTYGVDSVPVATDAILVSNLTVGHDGLRMNERPAVRTSLGKLKRIYGGRLEVFTFDVEIKGSGVAGTPPECGALFRAAAHSETIVASTSVTYAPVSTGHESGTLYYYRDGKRKIARGVRINLAFNYEAGSAGMMSITAIGHVDAETDTTIIAPTYDSSVPVPILSGAFAWGAYAATISKLAFDMGHAFAKPADINAADGYAAIQITGRDITGSIDPHATLLATKNWETDLTLGTTRAINLGPIGSVVGNIYRLTAPAAYVMDLSNGEVEGVTTYDVPIGFAESTTDNEVSHAFT